MVALLVGDAFILASAFCHDSFPMGAVMDPWQRAIRAVMDPWQRAIRAAMALAACPLESYFPK